MKLFAALCFVGCCLAITEAHAGNAWLVCDVGIQVDPAQSSRKQLSVRVSQHIGELPADCQLVAVPLTFALEMRNYQSPLPLRAWPRPGSQARLQYRYLNGIGKVRGPCRIVHYARLAARPTRAGVP